MEVGLGWGVVEGSLAHECEYGGNWSTLSLGLSL